MINAVKQGGTGKPGGRQIIGRVRGEARAPVNGSRKKELALCGNEDVTTPIWAAELRSTAVTELLVRNAYILCGDEDVPTPTPFRVVGGIEILQK